jgi:hypothetical protein
LPASLLDRFAGAGTAEGLMRCLDFIKPVTTATAGGGARRPMGT